MDFAAEQLAAAQSLVAVFSEPYVDSGRKPYMVLANAEKVRVYVIGLQSHGKSLDQLVIQSAADCACERCVCIPLIVNVRRAKQGVCKRSEPSNRDRNTRADEIRVPSHA